MHGLLIRVVGVQHRAQQWCVVQGGVKANVRVHALLLQQVDVLKQAVDGHASPHAAQERDGCQHKGCGLSEAIETGWQWEQWASLEHTPE